MNVHLGLGWNGAHRSLIHGWRAASRNLIDLDSRIAEGEKILDDLRQQRAVTIDEIEEHNIAIDRSGYKPPAGFSKWGERLGAERVRASTEATNGD